MKDLFTKRWITENSIRICDSYEDGMLTLRALHYQLVAIGMTNTIQHYKRVVNAMIDARWEGLISFNKFSDHDRGMLGETSSDLTILEDETERGKRNIKAWMDYYVKNRWENQIYYPEVFIEKKALQGVFESVCSRHSVALGACKGYPSLTFLNEAAERFITREAEGKIPIILYFGDYDPSGEDIPRAIEENIKKLGCESIEVRRFALMEDQVIAWKLPSAPAKATDSRTKNWEGIGQVELDAVEPRKLQDMCKNAIESVFDQSLYDELLEVENKEREIYKIEMKRFVNTL